MARRSSIRTRLRLGLAGVALILSLLATASVVSFDRLGGAVATILRENYASVIACEDMKEALEREDSAAQLASSGREDLARPMLDESRLAFAAAFAAEARNITLPDEGERVGELDRLYRDYLAGVDRVAARPAGERSAAYLGELLPRFTRLKDAVQGVLRMNQAAMERADREAKALAGRSTRVALGLSIVAVLAAGCFAWWMPRAAFRPVDALARTVRAVGDGNLNVTVEDPRFAEIVPLADAFKKMLERLRAYRESSLGELLAAKDLARATFECMLDPMVVLDREGGVLLANAAAEETFGLRMGSAAELREARLAIPESLAAARDQVFATGAPVLPRSLSEAMRAAAPGGPSGTAAAGDRYYLVRALALRVAPGEPPSAIVLAQDVTRFRRIDELKSDMVATVSHEFKTPLTSLRMATHLLLEPTSGPLTEAQRELVTTARDDTERLRTMVEDLLDVVRIEHEAGALHRVEVDPFGLLCEVADAHRTVARDKGVALEVARGAAPSGLVAVDPERLTIAVANLVANAIRHTPAGGRVSLAARQSDDGLSISVTDNGEGMDPAAMTRILEGAPSSGPVSGDRERHGLGLAIAREIALQHGGEVAATGKPGEGCVFTLSIPRRPPAPTSPAAG